MTPEIAEKVVQRLETVGVNANIVHNLSPADVDVHFSLANREYAVRRAKDTTEIVGRIKRIQAAILDLDEIAAEVVLVS